MNYRSVRQLSSLVARNLSKIPEGIEAIVGIPRSGMLVADLLGLHLSLPIVSLGTVCAGGRIEVGKRLHYSAEDTSNFLQQPRKLLVVDDSCGTGGALKSAKRLLSDLQQVVKHEYSYLVAYTNDAGKRWTDIWLEQIEKPRAFEWNWVSNAFLRTACIDIDGVLCRDPTKKECDEESGGVQYRKFLLGVPLLRRLRQPLGTLVTSRLERWRPETEQWLAKQKIAYTRLVMMPFKTVRERKAYGHARYKANQLKKHKGCVFVESAWKQAVAIHKITKRPVLCTENMEMLCTG